MNKIYTLIWNCTLQCWVVASELTKRRGKKSSIIATTALAAPLLIPNLTQAENDGKDGREESSYSLDDFQPGFNTTLSMPTSTAGKGQKYTVHTPSVQVDETAQAGEVVVKWNADEHGGSTILPLPLKKPSTAIVFFNVTANTTGAENDLAPVDEHKSIAEENSTARVLFNVTANTTGVENNLAPVDEHKSIAKVNSTALVPSNVTANTTGVESNFAPVDEHKSIAEVNSTALVPSNITANTTGAKSSQSLPQAEWMAASEDMCPLSQEAIDTSIIKEPPLENNATSQGNEDSSVQEIKAVSIKDEAPLDQEVVTNQDTEQPAEEAATAAPTDSSPVAEVAPATDASSAAGNSSGTDEAGTDEAGEEEAGEEEASEEEASEEEAASAPVEVAVAPAAVAIPLGERGPSAIRPEAGSYNSNAWAANTMFQMNLSDRLGSYFHGEGYPHQGSAWVRYSGSHSHLDDTSGQLRTKGDKNTVLMGVDMLTHSTDSHDQVTVGVMGGYGHYSGRTRSNLSGYSSLGKVDGYSLGLYGTYQQNPDTQRGIYVDSRMLWNAFDNRVKGDDLPHEKYKSKGMTASLELGYNATIAERNNVKYTLQPHAQLMYQNVRSENFRESDGTRIGFLNGSRVQTVLGLRAAAHIPTGATSVVTPHIEANWLHSTKGYGVSMNNTNATMNGGRNVGQFKLGVEGEVNQRVSLNVELFHNQGNEGYSETGGNLAVKYRY